MNHFYSEGDSLDYTPDSAKSAGELVEIGGKVGILSNDLEAGQLGAARIKGVIKLDNSGVIFADGATVGYDATDKDAVAAGDGDFNCGTCVGGAAADEQVTVLLNG